MGVVFGYTSYGYNYVSLWDKGMSSVNRPAELIAIYDAISSWTDCPYYQAGSCGIWAQRDIPAFLKKNNMPLAPACRTRPRTGWQRHPRRPAFQHGELHVRRRAREGVAVDRLTWGNLNGYIPDTDPDYNVSLITAPAKKNWPGM